MAVSVFSIVKNEAQFIGYGVMSLLPHVDEIVYADGNSTDGTLEIIEHIQKKYDVDKKLRVVRGADCKDLKDDYVRLFNDLMKECKGDYLWYCHPDMILTKMGKIEDAMSYSVNMRSFAGENAESEITMGRSKTWKSIMKNTMGLHYWGWYGHPAEDMYFKHITGNAHEIHSDYKNYPYGVKDSGIELWHFCECKPRVRREEKMEKVLSVNKLVPQDKLSFGVTTHPRVTLESGNSWAGKFEFVPRRDPLPEVFKYKEEFDQVLGRGDESIRSLVGA